MSSARFSNRPVPRCRRTRLCNYESSDLYATGAASLRKLAIVAIPMDAPPDQAEEMLYQVLAGARAVFDPEGITLLGGHTTTATELIVGFTIDGYAGERLLAIDGLEVGDHLLLTKSLGTGVLLHADMQGRVSGPWLQATIDTMLSSNADAARVATELGAKAVTDITGFGSSWGILRRCCAEPLSARCSTFRKSRAPLALSSSCSQGLRSTFHPDEREGQKGHHYPGGRPEGSATRASVRPSDFGRALVRPASRAGR